MAGPVVIEHQIDARKAVERPEDIRPHMGSVERDGWIVPRSQREPVEDAFAEPDTLRVAEHAQPEERFGTREGEILRPVERRAERPTDQPDRLSGAKLRNDDATGQ